MALSRGTIVKRIGHAPEASSLKSSVAGISGIYEIRLPVDVRITERASETEACDAFAGLDRLDRDELDDDGPGAPIVIVPDTVRDFPVTPRYRRSA